MSGDEAGASAGCDRDGVAAELPALVARYHALPPIPRRCLADWIEWISLVDNKVIPVNGPYGEDTVPIAPDGPMTDTILGRLKCQQRVAISLGISDRPASPTNLRLTNDGDRLSRTVTYEQFMEDVPDDSAVIVYVFEEQTGGGPKKRPREAAAAAETRRRLRPRTGAPAAAASAAEAPDAAPSSETHEEREDGQEARRARPASRPATQSACEEEVASVYETLIESVIDRELCSSVITNTSLDCCSQYAKENASLKVRVPRIRNDVRATYNPRPHLPP